ncbi:MAG: hypothetical protein JRG91_07015 [Deltaproteobacteria bacterium]|nr:hypothetical protein [Deltaproteobacteria bacterium]
MRHTLLASTTAVLLAAAAPLLIAACDEGYADYGDAAVELTVDLPGDAADDSSPPCSFPEGPYAFNMEGDTVGPMSWPSALAGLDETLAADLAVMHCDPSVNSIFVMLATMG